MKKILISMLAVAAIACFNGPGLHAQSRLTPEADARARELMARMTEQEKLEYVGGDEWMYIRAIDRLGIPRVKMSDGPQGLGTHGNSTAYPCAVMLTATWNPDLAYRYGESLGHDCNARGVNVVLGPAVNIYRAAMCGRNFEYMGEDPWLASRTAVGYIRGVQDQGVMAVVKHFVANNQDYDRDHVSSDIGERALNEIYFPTFRAAVQEAGVGSVMTSYNLLNSVWTTENRWLLQDVLRRRWGFGGIIMSDWGSTHNALPSARNGLDLEMPAGEKMSPEFLRKMLEAGEISWEDIDRRVFHILRTCIAFGFFDPKPQSQRPLDDPASRATALEVAREGAVLLKNEGVLPIDRRQVKRIAVVGPNARKIVCGGGSGRVTPFSATTLWDGLEKYASKRKIKIRYVDLRDYMPDVVFVGAGSSEPGLRGEYFLGTELEGKPVAVRNDRNLQYDWLLGPGIEGVPQENYSVRWTGKVRPQASGDYEFLVGGDDGYRMYFDGKLVAEDWSNHAFNAQTYACRLEAGREYDVRLEYYQSGGGASFEFSWSMPGVSDAAFVAELDKADLVVANIGFNASNEAEGGDRTFDLPKSERELLLRVLKSKTPVVGVVNAGGGVHLTDYVPSLKGLLWAWYPGQEGGQALAEILFGEVGPSGKLPITIEKQWEDNPVYANYYAPEGTKRVEYKEGVFVGYRGYDRLKREVLFPFGAGMTYSTFALDDVVVRNVSDGEPLVEVEYTLKNTGKRAASEVVQIYVGKRGGSAVARPEKELKCYRKIALKPGESKRFTERLDKRAFSYFAVDDDCFVLDPGDYTVQMGFSSRDIVAERGVTVE